MDIFLSHSTKDTNSVNELLTIIEKAGIGCWIAPRNICGGMPYADEIVSAIKQCRIVLLVVSANTLKSEHVLNEIEVAVNNQKIILPFKIDTVEYTPSFQYYLNRKHRIEAIPDPTEYYAELTDTLSYLLNKPEDIVDTEGDEELIAIRERNRKRLINKTKEKRLSFGLSIQADDFADESHYYKSIKRIDVIDTPNLKYSNYRWMEIENVSDKPTGFIIHKECGENKVRFTDMRFLARDITDDTRPLLDAASLTEIQPNFEQVIKIPFKKELHPGETMKVFYRLDWPGEPGSYCDELSTSISLTRYTKGVGKLIFGILDTIPLYGFELHEISAGFEVQTSSAIHKDMRIEDDPGLEPLHGKIAAAGVYYNLSDIKDSTSYRILYRQRDVDLPIEDLGF